jgi:hypothetical protein
MSLTIELSAEMERELRDEAARRGLDPAGFTLAILEERLAEARQERARRVAELLDQWDAEDAAHPDESPLPVIPPLSLREIRWGRSWPPTT